MSTDDILPALERIHIEELMKAHGVPEVLIQRSFTLSKRFPGILRLLRMWRDDPDSREAIMGDIQHLIDTAPSLADFFRTSPLADGEIPLRCGTILYGVFGVPLTSPDRELLGIYSTPERARAFIDAQPVPRRANMQLDPIVVDANPSDPFWLKPPEPEPGAV